LFSYPDTQRHRLGANYALIPVNCPYSGKLVNYQRDGAMRIDANGGNRPNYSPNSHGGPVSDPRQTEAPIQLQGTAGRTEYPQVHRADDFEQAGLLYRVLSPAEQARLVNNIASHMVGVRPDIQRRQIEHFFKADPDYGQRVAQQLNLKVEHAAEFTVNRTESLCTEP
jgi:catalase